MAAAKIALPLVGIVVLLLQTPNQKATQTPLERL
jgi:hypothetical protein